MTRLQPGRELLRLDNLPFSVKKISLSDRLEVPGRRRSPSTFFTEGPAKNKGVVNLTPYHSEFGPQSRVSVHAPIAWLQCVLYIQSRVWLGRGCVGRLIFVVWEIHKTTASPWEGLWAELTGFSQRRTVSRLICKDQPHGTWER